MLWGAHYGVAPPDVREGLAVPRGELSDVLGRIAGSAHIREVFLLVGEHRTEVYMRGRASALEDIHLFWQERAGAALDGLGPTLYEKRDEAAVYHLFALGAGLDPTILGKRPTLVQLKETLAAARRAGTIGSYLEALLNRTIEVAKRVRREAGRAPSPAHAEELGHMLLQEADQFIRWARSHRATTAITALERRAEGIRRAELLKIEGKLRHLSPGEREALESLTLSIVDKLLHPSKKALQEAVGLGEASDYLRAASELFDLEDP